MFERFKSLMSQSLKRTSSQMNEVDLLELLYWIKVIIAVAVGLVVGLTGIRGATGHLVAAGIFFFVFSTYTTRVIKVDEDSYGGRLELLKDSGMQVYATFVLTWILSYTAFHS
ncbi:hypothetical protein PCE1_002597 [Barthelona sp. PCE]